MCFITSQSAVDLGREQPILMPQVYFGVSVCVCVKLFTDVLLRSPAGGGGGETSNTRSGGGGGQKGFIAKHLKDIHACIHT